MKSSVLLCCCYVRARPERELLFNRYRKVTPDPGANSTYVTCQGYAPQFILLAITSPLLRMRSTTATCPAQEAPCTPGCKSMIAPTTGELDTCQPNWSARAVHCQALDWIRQGTNIPCN